MRIFLSVGEPSGDLHASNLIGRLHRSDPSIEFVGFGGPKMQKAGCRLLHDMMQLAVMFFSGALKNIRRFRRLIAEADQYFAQNSVDAVVLIDFSGFNWWIARKAKRHGIPVFYYGVPQMWAWASWRIHKLRRLVDHVLCKLPFEVAWFRERGCRATYIGHPYFDQLEHQVYDQAFVAHLQQSKKPKLLLLPGSRDQEIDKHLAMMIQAARMLAQEHPQLQLFMGCYNERHQAIARSAVDEAGVQIECLTGRTPELMKISDICLACSGSVSLELMYHRLPTVIVYKLNPVLMFLQSIFLRCRYITLVNLIATDQINRPGWFSLASRPASESLVPMPEYLTMRDCPEQLIEHLDLWLCDEASRQRHIKKLDQLSNSYARSGATDRAADYILEKLTAAARESRKRIAA